MDGESGELALGRVRRCGRSMHRQDRDRWSRSVFEFLQYLDTVGWLT